MSKINVEWKGNIYIELFPFNQKNYETCLITDPADPNYLGTFKEVKDKFFNYLQAKGRGEDVKSPISLQNLKSSPRAMQAIYRELGSKKDINFAYDNENSVILKLDTDIELKSGNLEGKLTSNSSVKSKMLDELFNTDPTTYYISYNGKTSGSFEYDRNFDLEYFNEELHDREIIPEDYSVYLEYSETSEKIFGEILNDKNECLQSFTFEPQESFLSRNYSIDIPLVPKNIYLCPLIKEITDQLYAYINDKDIDEMKQEQAYEKEHGNFYKAMLKEKAIFASDPYYNDPVLGEDSKPSFNCTLAMAAFFKSKELHQGTYYKYCDPDKISFKEFKNEAIHDGIAFCNLNKHTQDYAKELLLNCKKLYYRDDGPFRFHIMNINTSFLQDLDLLGRKNLSSMFDQVVESGKKNTSVSVDMSDNIKHYFDQDFEVFNMRDYGDEIGGSFIYRNLELEFDYKPDTCELSLYQFDYETEDPETGYYKQIELPPFLQNELVQDMLTDQIDLQVNNFIAENRYGSLDDMLKAAEEKTAKTVCSKTEKSKDDLEL